MEEKYQCFQSVYHSCSANAGTFFSKKNHLTFTQVCRRLCIKLCRRKVPVDPPQELPVEMIHQLCLSWLRMRIPGLRLQRGLLSFPWTSLSSFACQQKGQALGWAAAQPEVRKMLNIPDQPSSANPLPWSVPARGSWGCLSMNQPLQALPCGSSAPSQWWTGTPARPRSPPLHHTRPLSSPDANGLECFLRHKASHCFWEVLLLVFLFQLDPATHQLLSRHNAALCGCLQQHLENALTGTSPEHEMKGLC